MTNKRQIEIHNEAKRRLDLWLHNSNFNEMTTEGSFIRFNMGLGMMGYPFEKESWMGDDFESFITEEEFHTEEYDQIMENLFQSHLHLLKLDY